MNETRPSSIEHKLFYEYYIFGFGKAFIACDIHVYSLNEDRLV